MSVTVTVDSTTTLRTGGALDWIGRPSAKTRPDGVVVEVYYRATGHATNDGALYIHFSDDYGATWTAENTALASEGGGAIPLFPMNPPVTAGEDGFEPYLYQMPNGDLVLHMWRFDYLVSNGGTYQSRSEDGGLTWTVPDGPIQFAGLTGAQNGKTYATDDDTIVDGVLYAGARVYNDPDQDPSSVVLISTDDNGETWTRVATIVSATAFSNHGTQEFGLEYIGNDTFIAIIRDVYDVLGCYRSYSYDLGLTWTPIADISSQVGIFSRPRVKTRAHIQNLPNWWRDNVLFLTGFVHQTPGSSTSRRNAICVSTDHGTTWDGPSYIDTTSQDGGYSTDFWDPTTNQYVVHNYRGTLTAADLKQYRLTIEDIDVKPGMWVDWGNDGAFDESATASGTLPRLMPEAVGISDDITTDVHTVDWSYGGSADHVSNTNPGTMTFTVQNADGKYNPDNTSSVLYGKLKPGRAVWFGLNADGTATGVGQQVYGIFAGYIREIVPLVENGATALAEIICEDPLGAYSRRPAKVAASTDYSYHSLRRAILDDIGEELFELAHEVDTLPLAAADSDNALGVLEEINKATGSRHWANPANSKESFYSYTVVDRHHKLEDAADDAINADDVQAISGYRVTEEPIVNIQAADVSPARFPAGVDTVWTYAETSFPLTTKRTIWAQFEDFTKDAVLDYTNTGGAITTTLTNFGTTAKIELWSASSSVVENLTIEGRTVIRDASEAVTAEDIPSQIEYGKRSGGTISSTYSSTTALAQGIADYAVWKFAQPLKRPGITQINELPTALERDLYDTIELTVDRLSVVSRRFEIIGIAGHVEAGGAAPLVEITWELQETRNQSALSLFTLNDDVLDGPAVLAR